MITPTRGVDDSLVSVTALPNFNGRTASERRGLFHRRLKIALFPFDRASLDYCAVRSKSALIVAANLIWPAAKPISSLPLTSGAAAASVLKRPV